MGNELFLCVHLNLFYQLFILAYTRIKKLLHQHHANFPRKALALQLGHIAPAGHSLPAPIGPIPDQLVLTFGLPPLQ